MGVPAFFKWLCMRYPKIVIEVNSKGNSNDKIVCGRSMTHNSKPEVDNLYLDMNGIIHPCCHPTDRPQPNSIDDMINDVFEYVDVLISIINPKKLIYLAIDGVAPRAKMNQQRSRRFRAALEAKETREKEEEVKKEWAKKGLIDIENKLKFDSNVITPGTEFMDKLSKALELYITNRLENDYRWKNRVVLFSDSSVPGEGEHKILEHIRYQRSLEEYNPNTSHCIYGADADLIMLSLITHEPNFCIIRESVNDKTFRKCDACGKTGHVQIDCPTVTGRKEDIKTIQNTEFSILNVAILREYLELEFQDINFPFKYYFERIIDDFVLLCFFVGNDFLPHLPSLKIREGGIDAILYLYKQIIPCSDGYLTENGKLNLSRVENIFKCLALIEDEFFRELSYIDSVHKNNRDKKGNYYKSNNNLPSNLEKFKALNSFDPSPNEKYVSLNNSNNVKNIEKNHEMIDLEENDELDLVEIRNIVNKNKINPNPIQNKIKNEINNVETFNNIVKEKLIEERKEKEKEYKDPVQLGQKGWKERYYYNKFHVSTDDEDFMNLIKRNYIEGICWVFEYYYNGCVSWDWYYCFHYAPFISDLTNIRDLEISFNKGSPFSPIEQLLAVLPPASSNALPQILRKYMHNKNSPIIDFYPKNILLDINGEPFAWMGVNLIPFIEEDRIKEVVSLNAKYFNETDSNRNITKEGRVFLKENTDIQSLVGYNLKEDDNSHQIGENYTNKSGLKYLSIGTVKKTKVTSYILKKQFVNLNNLLDFIIIKRNENVFDKNDLLQLEKLNTYKLNDRLIDINIINDNNTKSKLKSLFNFNRHCHSSMINKGLKKKNKMVIEDNIESYSKKSYKGDIAINLVKKVLSFNSINNPEFNRLNLVKNDFNVNEFNFHKQHYDNHGNAIKNVSYDPRELNYLKKKQYNDIRLLELTNKKNEDEVRDQNPSSLIKNDNDSNVNVSNFLKHNTNNINTNSRKIVNRYNINEIINEDDLKSNKNATAETPGLSDDFLSLFDPAEK